MIISLKNAALKEEGEVGVTARDLSRINNRGIKTGLTAVMDISKYKELMNEYGVRIKIQEIINNSSTKEEALIRITTFLKEIELPKELIDEAREIISILREGISREERKPLLIIPSPTERDEVIIERGIQVLIDEDELKEKIVNAYLSTLNLELLKENKFVDTALIFQVIENYEKTGLIEIETINEYKVKAVKGLINFYEKDYLDKGEIYKVEGYPEIVKRNELQTKIIERNGKLSSEKISNEERVLNDKEVISIVDLLKRIRREYPSITKMYWGIINDEIYVLFTIRKEIETRKIEQIKEEIPIIPEREEEKIIEEEDKEIEEMEPSIEEDLEFLEEIESLESEQEIPEKEGIEEREIEKNIGEDIFSIVEEEVEENQPKLIDEYETLIIKMYKYIRKNGINQPFIEELYRKILNDELITVKEVIEAIKRIENMGE